jgi:hypothetical protein
VSAIDELAYALHENGILNKHGNLYCFDASLEGFDFDMDNLSGVKAILEEV